MKEVIANKYANARLRGLSLACDSFDIEDDGMKCPEEFYLAWCGLVMAGEIVWYWKTEGKVERWF